MAEREVAWSQRYDGWYQVMTAKFKWHAKTVAIEFTLLRDEPDVRSAAEEIVANWPSQVIAIYPGLMVPQVSYPDG